MGAPMNNEHEEMATEIIPDPVVTVESNSEKLLSNKEAIELLMQEAVLLAEQPQQQQLPLALLTAPSSVPTRNGRRTSRRASFEECRTICLEFVGDLISNMASEERKAVSKVILQFCRGRKQQDSRRSNQKLKATVGSAIIQEMDNVAEVFGYDDIIKEIIVSILNDCMDLLRNALIHCPEADVESFCCKYLGTMLHSPRPDVDKPRLMRLINDLFTAPNSQLSLASIEAVIFEMDKLYFTYANGGASFPEPSKRDIDNWLLVVQVMHVRLSNLPDVTLAYDWLPQVFNAMEVLSIVAMDKHLDCQQTINDTYEVLLRKTVSAACRSKELYALYHADLDKCFQIVMAAFQAGYYGAQYLVAILFEIGAESFAERLLEIVATFQEREQELGWQEIEHAVAAAIKALGPEIILQHLPLKREDGTINWNRLHLLKLFKNSIRSASTEYFVNEILPYIIDLNNNRPPDKTSSEDRCASDMAKLVCNQLLEMLAAICESATDIGDNFQNIAAMLHNFIKNPETRATALTALRACLLNAKTSQDEAALTAIRSYDTYFLYILYDSYMTEDRGEERAMALACLRMFVSVSKRVLSQDVIRKALTNLNVDSNDRRTVFVKRSILQFFAAVLPWLNCGIISAIFKGYLQHLPDIEDEEEQMEAYGFLKRICSSHKNGCKKFVSSNKKRIYQLLWDCVRCPVFHNADRFEVLLYLMLAQVHLEPLSNQLVLMVREAISMVKLGNLYRSKHLFKEVLARKTAAETEIYVRIFSEAKEANVNMQRAQDALIFAFERALLYDQLQEFIALVGHDISVPARSDNVPAVILTLTNFLRCYAAELGPEHLWTITKLVIFKAMTIQSLLLQSAALEFIRVYYQCLSVPTTFSYTHYKNLQVVLGKMMAMRNGIKILLRPQIGKIFEVLAEKFDCNVVHNILPKSRSLIRNLMESTYLQVALRRSNRNANNADSEELIGNIQFPPSIEKLEDVFTV